MLSRPRVKFLLLELIRYGVSILASQVHLILSPLYAGVLDLKNYGLLELCFSSVGLLTSIFGLGLNQTSDVQYFKGKGFWAQVEASVAYLFFALPVCLLLTFLPFVSEFGASLLFNDPTQTTALRLVVWCSFFSFFRFVMMSLFTVSYRSHLYMIYEIFYSLVLLFFIFLGKKFDFLTVNYILLCQILALCPLLATIAFQLFDRKILGRLPEIARTLPYKDMLKMSIPLAAMSICTWVSDISDRWVISKYAPDPLEIGRYALGYRLTRAGPTVIAFLYTNIYYRFLFKKLFDAKDDPEEIKRLMRKNLHFLMIYCVLLICFLLANFLLIYKILPHFFNKDYSDVISIVPLLSLGFLFQALANLFTLTLRYYEKNASLLYVNIAAAVTNLLLCLAIVPFQGMQGAALATAITYFLMLVLVYFKTRGVVKKLSPGLKA